MRSTMALSWKSLVSTIHPPLPLSPRESARLLALLDTSFKHQLNRQHPAGLPNSEQHADNHLHSILKNPLFATRDGFQGIGSKESVFARVQDLVKRPMDVFRAQVSAGTATAQSACLCLQAQYNSCLASPDTTLASTMRASGAGTTVLEWLLSSGAKESRFFELAESTRLMVPFLITEGQHGRILQWLQGLYVETSKDRSPEKDRKYRKLLLDVIKAEVSLGQGLESATGFFTKVARNAKDSDNGLNGLNSALIHTAYYLTTKLMDAPKSAEHQVSTLEPFINISKTLTTSKRSLIAALHDVYLASHPSPRAALQYFQGLWPRTIAALSPTQRQRVIFLGLKTAELCLGQGRQAEATQIMDFLQRNFKTELGSHQSSEYNFPASRGSGEAEHRSLRLLDSLAIA